MFVVLMSALLMAAAEPAPPSAAPASTAAAPPAAAAAAAKKANGGETVCWEEKPTGSHLSKTICATRAEVERAEQEAKDSLTNRKTPSGKGMGPS